MLPGILLIGLALAGVVSSRAITRVSPGKSSGTFPFEFCQRHGFEPSQSPDRTRVLWLAVMGSVYFWFLGLLMQTNILFFGKIVLGVPEARIGYLLAALAVGIGLAVTLPGSSRAAKSSTGSSPRIHRHFHLSVHSGLAGLDILESRCRAGGPRVFGGIFHRAAQRALAAPPRARSERFRHCMANLMTFVGMLVATGFTGCCPLSCI
jgi:hypothetical protein